MHQLTSPRNFHPTHGAGNPVTRGTNRRHSQAHGDIDLAALAAAIEARVQVLQARFAHNAANPHREVLYQA